MLATVIMFCLNREERAGQMAAVMIGVTRTRVRIPRWDGSERPLGRLRIRASVGQAAELVAWAMAWPERTWAVEGASGRGHLLA